MDEIRVWGDKEEMAKDLAKEEAQEKAEIEMQDKEAENFIDNLFENVINLILNIDVSNKNISIKAEKEWLLVEQKNDKIHKKLIEMADCTSYVNIHETKLQKIYEYYKEANKNLEKLMEDIK